MIILLVRRPGGWQSVHPDASHGRSKLLECPVGGHIPNQTSLVRKGWSRETSAMAVRKRDMPLLAPGERDSIPSGSLSTGEC